MILFINETDKDYRLFDGRGERIGSLEKSEASHRVIEIWDEDYIVLRDQKPVDIQSLIQPGSKYKIPSGLGGVYEIIYNGYFPEDDQHVYTNCNKHSGFYGSTYSFTIEQLLKIYDDFKKIP